MAAAELVRDQLPRGYLGMRQTMTWLLEPMQQTADQWAKLSATIPCSAIFGGKDVYCPATNHTYLAEAGVSCLQSAIAEHLLSFDDPSIVSFTLQRHIKQK